MKKNLTYYKNKLQENETNLNNLVSLHFFNKTLFIKQLEEELKTTHQKSIYFLKKIEKLTIKNLL